LEFKREGCVLGRIDKKVQGGYNVGIQTSEVGAVAFNQNKYINDYVRENYDRIEIRIPKGNKPLLKKLATEHNITDDKGKISVGRLFVEAVEEKYHIDLSKPE